MKKTRKSFLVMLILFCLGIPQVLGHEHRTLIIGKHHIEITLGSLNEPVYVGDKSGVQLIVKRMEGANSTSEEHSSHQDAKEQILLLGLEKTLQVEIGSEDQKKILPFAAAWGKPGEYHAIFYPTSDKKYSYRVFGQIEKVPIDLLFECSEKGHVMEEKASEQTAQHISSEVILLKKSGSFGCPKSKEEVSIPPIIAQKGQSEKEAKISVPLSVAAILLSAISLGFVASLFFQVRKRE